MPLIHGPQLGLSGRYKFHVLHPDTRKPITGRDGVPIYRDASGFVKRAGVWQPNLITNAGLDLLPEQAFLDWSGMRRWLWVGTGSTAPAVTDTDLDAFQGDSNSNGTGNNVRSYSATGNIMTLSGVRAVQYTAAGAESLTEFGFSENARAGGGTLAVRELLRDEVGDPTTVALTTGQQLLVSHEAFTQAPWQTAVAFDVVEKNLAGTTVNTESYTGYLYLLKGGSDFANGMYAVEPEYYGSVSHDFIYGDARVIPNIDAHVNVPEFGQHAYELERVIPASYQAGDHFRDYGATLTPTEANDLSPGIKSFAFAWYLASDVDAGALVVLDDPQYIPKVNTHTLTLTLRLSWARA